MKITFTNANSESISISNAGTFRIFDINGLSQVDAEVQTVKSPFQDGATRVDTLLGMRNITIEFGIFADNEADLFMYRNRILSIFHPKLPEGMLRCEFANGVKEIPVTPEGTVDFPTGEENYNGKFQRVLVDLLCPDPYWLDIEATTQPMANVLGGLKFPLSFSGRSLQYSSRGTRVYVQNSGDVNSPVQITFKGEALNPIIHNRTTGEFIKVNRHLSATDKLLISTAFGKKKVEIEDVDGNRTNVMNWLDFRSTFFNLLVGQNELEYGSDSDIALSTVEVRWRNRYLGI